MNIQLRPWRREDAKDLVEIMNNKLVQDTLRDGLPYPYTVQDANEYLEHMLSISGHHLLFWAVTLEDRAIGSISVQPQDNIHRLTGEIGYALAQPYWGQGIMSKAVREVTDIVFAATNLVRIFGMPFESNIASRRVLEHAGFEKEGLLRKNAVKNHTIRNMCLYAKVR